MPRPRTSVLLPAWNAESTLTSCLDSLLRQSETNWECILVDDGSSDGTLEISQAFEARDTRIRVLQRPHAGIVESLNAGLALCGGKFIARMDADDRMHPERLALQHLALEENVNWAAVGCQVELVPADAVTEGRADYAHWLNALATPDEVRADAFVECPIAHPALFARRKAMLDFGYRDRGWPEDYDLVLRWLGGGLQLANVARPLLEWQETPGRLSRTSDVYGLDRFTKCKAFFLFEDFLKRRSRYILWGYGATGRALRKALEALGARPNQIVEVHPRRQGESIHGAPVISPETLAEPGGEKLIVCVAGENPRNQIRAALRAKGYRETVDYVCAA